MRRDWNEYFMRIATEVATRSTCDRKHVGAVIVRDRSILATGYNGSARGLDHCDDAGHMMEDGHCVRTVHAEANALAQAAKNGTAVDGAELFVTASPCWPCFKLVVNAGIKKIIFGEFYRDEKIFEAAKVLGLELVQDKLLTAAGQGPRADYASCGVCVITREGFKVNRNCSEHGPKRTGQGMVDAPALKQRFAYTRGPDGFVQGCYASPNGGDRRDMPACSVCKGDCPDKERFAQPKAERSNLEIAQEGVRAILAQDPRAAIAAVDRANNEAVRRNPQLTEWLMKAWAGPGVYDHHGGGVYTALFLATYRREMPPSADPVLEVKHHDTRARMIVTASRGEGGDDLMLHYLGIKEQIPEATTFVIYVSHTFGSVMARPFSWAGDDAWNDIVTWEEPYKPPVEKPRFVRRPDKEQPK